MLSAAVVARELTTPDNDSSDLSDRVQEGLAADYTDSSESDFTVENSDTVATRATVHATAPASDINTAGGGDTSEGVGTAGALHPPRYIWGPEEEKSLTQASAGKSSGRPAVGESHSRGRDREATGLPGLTDKLFEMLAHQDSIRREEDRQRRLQDEARRVQRKRDQRRLEAQE